MKQQQSKWWEKTGLNLTSVSNGFLALALSSCKNIQDQSDFSSIKLLLSIYIHLYTYIH